MRKTLIFATVLATISVPAFAQNHGNGNGNGHAQQTMGGSPHGNGKFNDQRRDDDFDRGRDRERNISSAIDRYEGRNQASNGCPPGLAKKNNGCLPPGQARRQFGIGTRYPNLQGYNIPAGYRGRYRDSTTAVYRYNNGMVYQIDPRTRLITRINRLLGQ